MPTSWAGGFLADALRDIGAINADTAKALDKAHESLGQPLDSIGRLEASANPVTRQLIQEAQAEANTRAKEIEKSVKEAEAKLAEANAKLEQVSVLSSALEAEKTKLEKEKGLLEQREQLFSMGFYASLTTTLIAGLGLVVGLPNSKLDRRLKELEIEHKTIELEKAKAEMA